MYARQRAAATTIAAAARALPCRRELAASVLAATTLQAAARRKACVSHYKVQRAAIVRAEALVRGKAARRLWAIVGRCIRLLQATIRRRLEYRAWAANVLKKAAAPWLRELMRARRAREKIINTRAVDDLMMSIALTPRPPQHKKVATAPRAGVARSPAVVVKSDRRGEAGLVVASDVQAQLRDALASSGSRVVELFRQWDADGDGTVSKAEFVRSLPELGLKATQEEGGALFDTFDPDGSGTIELKELEKLLRRKPGASVGTSGPIRNIGAAASEQLLRMQLGRQPPAGRRVPAGAVSLTPPGTAARRAPACRPAYQKGTMTMAAAPPSGPPSSLPLPGVGATVKELLSKASGPRRWAGEGLGFDEEALKQIPGKHTVEAWSTPPQQKSMAHAHGDDLMDKLRREDAAKGDDLMNRLRREAAAEQAALGPQSPRSHILTDDPSKGFVTYVARRSGPLDGPQLPPLPKAMMLRPRRPFDNSYF